MANLPQDYNETLFKNSIKFLHSAANIIPANSVTLKSHYTFKYRVLEHISKISLPRKKNKTQADCPRCCLQLSDGPPSYRVEPERQKSKFAKKMINKANQNGALTRYQAKYVKKLEKRRKNELVMACKFCKNEVVFPAYKPPRLRLDMNGNKTEQKKKPKKRKKDKFCGLQAAAVLSANSHRPGVFLRQNAAPSAASGATLNNPISRRRLKEIKKKSINKLSSVLSTVSDPYKSSNNLKNFLKSL